MRQATFLWLLIDTSVTLHYWRIFESSGFYDLATAPPNEDV